MEEQAIELPEPSAWRAAASYWKSYDSIPGALLPPLYEPEPLYTAEQVRAAVLAEREMCARLCDELKEEHMESAAQNNGRQSDFAFGYVNAAEELADAIRSGKPSP
jgi:hypothetical protein